MARSKKEIEEQLARLAEVIDSSSLDFEQLVNDTKSFVRQARDKSQQLMEKALPALRRFQTQMEIAALKWQLSQVDQAIEEKMAAEKKRQPDSQDSENRMPSDD